MFNQTFRIDGKEVGVGKPVYIIAEAGVAHFGSLEKAFRLVDLAVNSGADSVKFQVFKAKNLICDESRDWLDRLQSRELPYDAFLEIQAYCKKKNITFFATAHDEESLGFLTSMDVPVYKIGSGEVDNLPFIEKTASLGKPVILSTGMYSLEQVGNALEACKRAGNPDIALLHCVTSYPVSPEQVNLNAMDTIRSTYNTVTGYSDHTKGIHFPLAAVVKGARIIEKHITLDFNVPNAQDWKVSCGPEDLPLLVSQTRELEAGMGSGIKTPTALEKDSILWARKSLVALGDIEEGTMITADMLIAKRPGTGIPPCKIDEIIGKKTKATIKANTLIKREQIA